MALDEVKRLKRSKYTSTPPAEDTCIKVWYCKMTVCVQNADAEDQDQRNDNSEHLLVIQSRSVSL